MDEKAGSITKNYLTWVIPSLFLLEFTISFFLGTYFIYKDEGQVFISVEGSPHFGLVRTLIISILWGGTFTVLSHIIPLSFLSFAGYYAAIQPIIVLSICLFTIIILRRTRAQAFTWWINLPSIYALTIFSTNNLTRFF